MTSPSSCSSEEIISLRSTAAFNALYRRTHQTVFRYIYGLGAGSTQDAEDLTAETYIRAWQARRRFRGDAQAALGWLLRIARNLVFDRFRWQKRQPKNDTIETHILHDPAASPEAHAMYTQQVRLLWQQLNQLDRTQREILVLRYILGFQVRAIGEYLEIKENTVSVKIRRALEKLRQDWPNDDEQQTG
ncbi:MAG: sigma-70 family RNA polymerase sigma factor [Chloroflexi bacterium]|jgi:RNA polymerase sigma-70 factor, ECF subfamily|nr:sigma-70 family RNA polymerase sigma factor [Chloroflexota bacterium]